MIHAFVAASGRIHKLQAAKCGHEDPGESEFPNEWCCECQVACKDKHTCIDKFES